MIVFFVFVCYIFFHSLALSVFVVGCEFSLTELCACELSLGNSLAQCTLRSILSLRFCNFVTELRERKEISVIESLLGTLVVFVELCFILRFIRIIILALLLLLVFE